MFFDNPESSFRLLDVIELNQKNINIKNTQRNFNALSFRISANTKLINKDKDYILKDNSVCFVPNNLDYTRISKNDQLIVVHFLSNDLLLTDIEFFYPKNYNVLLEKFYKILKCWNSKEIGYQFKCTALFNEILYECYVETYIPQNQQSPIADSVKFMQEVFNQPTITIKEIADKSFISEVYFRKLFKKEYGISPSKYIANLRLQNAIYLIETNCYTLTEVAELSGYTDYSYFSAEFKKAKGIPPSKYFYNFNGQLNG